MNDGTENAAPQAPAPVRPVAVMPGAVVMSDAEALAAKLCAIRDDGDEFVTIELHRVLGSGRGETGGWEPAGTYEWEPAQKSVAQVCRELDVLAAAKGGGLFRAVVRFEDSAGFRMNQPVRAPRGAAIPPPGATTKSEGGDRFAELLAVMVENNRRADERQAQLLEALKQPGQSLKDKAEEYEALRKAFGGGEAAAAGRKSLAEELREVKETYETLFGEGSGKSSGALEVVDKFLTMIGPHLAGLLDSDDLGDEEGDETDEGDETAGDDQPTMTKRQRALHALLKKTANGLSMAAKANMSPEQTVAFALKHAKKGERDVLVKLAANPKLTGTLVKMAPGLLDSVAFVEQVRAEVLRVGSGAVRGRTDGDGASAAPAGATGADGKEAGAPVAVAAANGADTQRGAGDGGDAGGNAQVRGSGKAKPVRARGGGEGGTTP